MLSRNRRRLRIAGQQSYHKATDNLAHTRDLENLVDLGMTDVFGTHLRTDKSGNETARLFQ
jgi:hypothetical protein